MTVDPQDPVANRINAFVRAEPDPLLIATLDGGFVMLNERQPEEIAPCCVLLPLRVVGSINELDPGERAAFTEAMVRLGDALLACTPAQRVNYLILCNQAPTLHAHAIPRYSTEERTRRRLGPFEAYHFSSARRADPAGIDAGVIARLARALAPGPA